MTFTISIYSHQIAKVKSGESFEWVLGGTVDDALTLFMYRFVAYFLLFDTINQIITQEVHLCTLITARNKVGESHF